jgi:hypothetical protein
MAHDHHRDVTSSLTFHEKTVKMLKHWIKHNEDHAENYDKWAREINDRMGENISVLLNDAADLTIAINQIFEEAIKLLQKMEK